MALDEEAEDAKGGQCERAESSRQRAAENIATKWKKKVFRYGTEGDGAEAGVLKELLEGDEAQSSEAAEATSDALIDYRSTVGIEDMLQGLAIKFRKTMQEFAYKNIGGGMDVEYLIGHHVKDLKMIEERIGEAAGKNERLNSDAAELDLMHMMVCFIAVSMRKLLFVLMMGCVV